MKTESSGVWMARRVYEMALDTYYSMDETVASQKNKQGAIKKLYFSTSRKSLSSFVSELDCQPQERPYWLASAALNQAIHLKLIELSNQYDIPLAKAA